MNKEWIQKKPAPAGGSCARKVLPAKVDDKPRRSCL